MGVWETHYIYLEGLRFAFRVYTYRTIRDIFLFLLESSNFGRKFENPKILVFDLPYLSN